MSEEDDVAEYWTSSSKYECSTSASDATDAETDRNAVHAIWGCWALGRASAGV